MSQAILDNVRERREERQNKEAIFRRKTFKGGYIVSDKLSLLRLEHFIDYI